MTINISVETFLRFIVHSRLIALERFLTFCLKTLKDALRPSTSSWRGSSEGEVSSLKSNSWVTVPSLCCWAWRSSLWCWQMLQCGRWRDSMTFSWSLCACVDRGVHFWDHGRSPQAENVVYISLLYQPWFHLMFDRHESTSFLFGDLWESDDGSHLKDLDMRPVHTHLWSSFDDSVMSKSKISYLHCRRGHFHSSPSGGPWYETCVKIGLWW